MRTHVLDASAVLRYTDDEPGADQMEALILAANDDRARLILSAVSWGEVVGVFCDRYGLAGAKARLRALHAFPWEIMPVSESDAEAAATFKQRFNVPYTAAFAGSLTLSQGKGRHTGKEPVLVTADSDFKAVPTEVITIQFLPTKK